MVWGLLFLAGLFEIGWAIGLKYTHGFTRLWPTAATLLAMVISFGLLAAALKQLPVGTAYAVWTGIGAVGMVFLGEAVTAGRIASIGLITLGIIGLKLVTPH